MKLTERQREALEHIKEGKVHQRNYGYSAWRIGGPSSPTVVGRVISMKLADWKRQDDEYIAFLTEAGEDALQQPT
ncbi:hypothetical protein ACQU0X_25915 [Pseudovibrio ascidiaceicola]|uniref:hypothetical protein n=1 Tax=Pseudovibrio ascidiaceicola TaxID=285279 RepID=UPI003D36BFF8